MLHRLPPQQDPRDTLRDRLVRDYVRALDTGDDDAIDSLLNAAIEDPALDARFSDIDRALLEVDGIPSAQAAADVDALVQRHLTPQPDPSGPVTVGDVAASLKAARRVPHGDDAYNDALLSSTVATPHTFRSTDVEALLIEIVNPPSDDYVDAFASETARLILASSDAPALLAARSTRRPPSS